MDDIDERQDYIDTVDENRNLVTVYERLGSVESFLFRERRVYARPIAVDLAEVHTFLNFNTDIDGCVIELQDLCGVEIPIRKLTFIPQGVFNLKSLKSVLKKHLNLSLFDQNELANFHHCVGFQLFYEYGWECWIGLIPKHGRRRSVRYHGEVIKNKSFEVFKGIKLRVQKVLVTLIEKQEALKSLAKINVNDIGKMCIMPDDQGTILRAVQGVLDSFSDSEMELICFCFRFGEKSSEGISLKSFNRDHIKSVTVHSALDISSDDDIDLLWSAPGLSSVVGVRGSLMTCLSLTECGNYQSNLDGRPSDVGRRLREVCKQPGRLRFVQLYADVPHARPSTRFHPVSGVIAGGLCFPKATGDAFLRDAKEYISRIESDLLCTVNASCRLEIVSELDIFPDDVLTADHCLDVKAVIRLLCDRPLLVPFPSEVLSCIRRIGLWTTEQLTDLLNNYQKTGNVGATWKAFQLELAVEKLLWGRPLCLRSQIFSVNLGPGQEAPSRSLSDALGFLALEPYTSCMYTDESIPSTAIWTSSERVAGMIKRSTGLHDSLNGTTFVIGRRLIEALLKDFYELGGMNSYCRFGYFLSEMKQATCSFKVTGLISFDRLVQILSDNRRMNSSMVYGCLCKLVSEAGVPLRSAVEAGLNALEMTHFPAVEILDDHRNPVLRWTRARNYWRISGTGTGLDQLKSSPKLSALVKSELELRGLIYASKLKNAPVIFPWIEPCVRKLATEQLTEEQLVLLLAFISCIALITHGWFVQYDNFTDLMRQLPITQHRLRELEIQSRLGVPFFRKETVYRLHFTIPTKFHVETNTVQKSKPVEQPTTGTEQEVGEEEDFVHRVCNRIPEEDETEHEQKVTTRVSSCLPVVSVQRVRWSGQEIELLYDLLENHSGQRFPQTFELYKEKCVEMGIPFRTFKAFRCRLSRMSQDAQQKT